MGKQIRFEKLLTPLSIHDVRLGNRMVKTASSLTGADNPRPAYPQARELALDEIKDLVEKYGRAAERARKAGFDGVEIHAAHNYLIKTFLSRAWNRRQDAYGCRDMESRIRFAVEIIRSVRGLVGPDFIVGVRMNGAEIGRAI